MTVKKKWIIWLSVFLSISATGVWAPVSAHNGSHGSIPERAPNVLCSPDRCGWNSNDQIIDGYKYSNSRVAGVGHVGWWEEIAYLPSGTVFRIRACVGTIPFKTEDCGPAREISTPAPKTPEQIIRERFGGAAEVAIDVAWCESRLDPRAVSPGGGNHGLFQINSVHSESFRRVTGVSFSEGRYNAYFNTQFAKWLYDQSGWRPWTCRP